MQTKPLTKIQQGWLNHIHQATQQKISMSAYAKQNKLALKAFYNARSMLIKKGLLPPIIHTPLMPVTVSNLPSPKPTSSCRITLCNGVIVELAGIDVTSLLNSASQL
ncbi:IS66 family insertion sequence element accessory protein TnpA [Psychromonas antarctica]|jgi:hypothetical protein|uniref:IS66 family insertion sequence element accessory protein TnpA n=1 Tax=Psychromonas antarctica TaxID=67573 RepID=UPI001EE8E415|nr:hypothetical protein [Psychromonas antarctica]MCG6202740.1 hypothetical protein [Psychromonas antarctica]